MSEENKNEEIKEEVKEEELACDGNCESCEIDCLGDYEFEPIHNKKSIANIFQIVCKVSALLFLIFGTYTFVLSVIGYAQSYGEIPSVVEIIYSWLADVLKGTIVLFAIGEVVNLINRIKESIMY